MQAEYLGVIIFKMYYILTTTNNEYILSKLHKMLIIYICPCSFPVFHAILRTSIGICF
jgi:hypothetical protein